VTFVAPAFLIASVAAAAIVAALHFLARRRPRAEPFPTARFVPETPASAPTRAVRPSDLALLLLRVLTVLLVGASFARPVAAPERRSVARLALVDLSRAVRDASEALDSVSRLLEDGDLVLAFDSVPRRFAGELPEGGAPRHLVRDSVTALERSGARGSLSAALVAAIRTAPVLKRRADSVELVFVSPLAAEEWDAATTILREMWRGRAGLVRVHPATQEPLPYVEVRAAGDDPVRAAVALSGRLRERGTVRVLRDSPTPADSAWAESGGALVVWPSDATSMARTRPARVDTVGGIVAGGSVAVGVFERPAPSSSTGPAAIRAPADRAGTVVARYVDGAPAALERIHGEGCVREVAIGVPSAGDVALSDGMRRIADVLIGPCGGPRRLDQLPDTLVEILRGEGPLLDTSTLRSPAGTRSAVAPWLLLLAALALLAEGRLRRAEAER
jgi:hypothetical protein